MKCLLLTVLFGLAAALAVPDEKNIVQSTVSAVQRSLEGTGSLWAAVDLPEHAEVLRSVERRMKTKIGEFLKDVLDGLVNGIKDRVEKTKNVTHIVNDKVKELRDRLEELGKNAENKSKEAIEIIRGKVHEIVKSLQESLKDRETNLDADLDAVSKLKVRDLINKIRGRITEKVQDIRKYINEIAIDNEAVKDLKALLDKMNDSELAEILNNLMDLSGHELRHLKDLYKQLKELAGRTNGVLKEKVYDLLGYVQSLWKSGFDELIDRFHHIRSTLLEVIGNTKDLSVEAVKDALHHIKSYKEELGDLYQKLVQTLNKAIGKF